MRGGGGWGHIAVNPILARRLDRSRSKGWSRERHILALILLQVAAQLAILASVDPVSGRIKAETVTSTAILAVAR